MAYEYKEYMETPTASINITNTESTDVTDYATAQVVDNNLVPENILSGVSILGVDGSATIPTKISDLTDDTSTNPIDKADTLTNLTATVAELNYSDGVTSNIQTQLNDKASLSGENTFANKNIFSRTFTQGTNQLIMNNSYRDVFTCVDTNDPDTYTALSRGYVWNEAKQSDGSLDWVRYGTTEILYGKDDSSGTTTVECNLNFPTTSCEGTIALEPTVVTGTLSAGDTSITLSSSAITTSSILDIYTDTYGIVPKTMVASTGSVTMTFKAQESDLGIRLEVK